MPEFASHHRIITAAIAPLTVGLDLTHEKRKANDAGRNTRQLFPKLDNKDHLMIQEAQMVFCSDLPSSEVDIPVIPTFNGVCVPSYLSDPEEIREWLLARHRYFGVAINPARNNQEDRRAEHVTAATPTGLVSVVDCARIRAGDWVEVVPPVMDEELFSHNNTSSGIRAVPFARPALNRTTPEALLKLVIRGISRPLESDDSFALKNGFTDHFELFGQQMKKSAILFGVHMVRCLEQQGIISFNQPGQARGQPPTPQQKEAAVQNAAKTARHFGLFLDSPDLNSADQMAYDYALANFLTSALLPMETSDYKAPAGYDAQSGSDEDQLFQATKAHMVDLLFTLKGMTLTQMNRIAGQAMSEGGPGLALDLLHTK